MNFYKYLAKKISFTFLGVFLILTLFYIILAPLLADKNLNDKPFIVNYFYFIGSIFTGFGEIYNSSSFSNAQDYFFYYFKYSLLFETIAFSLSLLLGYLTGVFLAYKNGKLSDAVISLIIFIIASIPAFIIAPLMLLLAEVNDIPVNFVTPNVLNTGYMFLSLLLPISILLITSVSFFAVIVKNATVNILRKDFINIQKANGQSSAYIFWKSIFKNLIIDTINKLNSLLIIIISFALVLERIFQIPGQSLIFMSIFNSGEINVMMCLIFFKVLTILLISFFCEVIYDVLKVDNNYNFSYKILYKSKKQELTDE
ncbi:ABC transporter permease subunit [Mycoplasma tauri]|uniref:ABC transporter permease subunit n=1 Tax=Mycoplasma tauri TaxID=547987 RepID=UPI001CBE36C9|nr:ABC transporter permease [Mycoplasma tauri]MBZ4204051.1 ABC transporter permease [Mycoplasma tauri]